MNYKVRAKADELTRYTYCVHTEGHHSAHSVFMMAALGTIVPVAKLQDHQDYTLYSARAAYKC